MQKSQLLISFAVPLSGLLLITCCLTGVVPKLTGEDTPSLAATAPLVEPSFLSPTQKAVPKETPQQTRDQFALVPVAGQPLTDITDLWVSPQGDLWAATMDGIAIHSAEGWRRELEGVAIGKIAGSGRSGVVWVLSASSDEIFSFSGEKWKKFGTAQGWEPFVEALYLSPGIAESVVETPDGQVWLATGRDDLRRFDPVRDRWQKLTAEQIGFPRYDEPDYQGYFLTDVAVSGSGKVWVGGCVGQGEQLIGRGVVRLSDGRWNRIDAVEKACVLDIEVLPDGDAYIGDYNNLFWYTPATGNWKVDALPAFERSQLVEHVGVDSNGQLWVRVRRMGGASSYGGAAVYHQQENHDWVLVYETEVWGGYDFAAGPDGEVYFNSNGVVYRWRDRKLEKLGDLLEPSVLLAVDGSGVVWAASIGGAGSGLWQITP